MDSDEATVPGGAGGQSGDRGPGGTAWPATGVHAGRAVCRGLLRQALLGLAPGSAAAPWATARELWLVDPDFDDWPLDDPDVHAALAAWLRPGGRHVRLLGRHFETTARRHPRLARWRRDWTHAFSAWTPADGQLPPTLRGLLVAPLRLQWLDAPDWRLRCSTDTVHARLAQAELADFLQRCEAAWPATTLGL